MLLILFFVFTLHQVSLTLSEKAPPRSLAWHSRYHTLDEINEKLKEIDGRHDNAVLFSIGKSYQERDMMAIKITGANRENKPVMFIQCQIHAREWITGSACLYTADQLTRTRQARDDKATALLDKMDFVIVPVVNPDGYFYSWANKTTRSWHKNRRRLSGNNNNKKCSYGVDLNRNFGYKWGCCTDDDLDNPQCEDTWKGPAPFSEIETRNIRDYLTSLGGNLKGFIDFQAYGQDWYYPWRHTDEDSPDKQEQMRVAIEARKAISKAGWRTRYTVQSAGQSDQAGGTSLDWVYGHLGVKYTFHVNLRRGGKNGYHLPEEFLLANSQEAFAGLSAAVKAMNV